MTQPDIFDDDAPWAEWLPELRMILFAYNSVLDERFSDTPEVPSKAMRSYLRMATYYPGRAFRATAEILEVLKRGLDSPEVAAELATMPKMGVPQGRTREDCLKMMIPHLVAFTESGEHVEPAVPETRWEWRQRLPNLSELLGGSYHQGAMDYLFPGVEDGRYDEAVLADYYGSGPDPQTAAVVAEIGELLEMGLDEEALEAAVTAMGSDYGPPPELSRESWLVMVAQYLSRRLQADGYQPPEGLNPAYPPHDKRAFAR
ncbi:hypothetical protein KGQ20_04380 [Catenulispora sp. NF23]|uniref:contact-dependent growth inhibition system immunity protein n=1 Tax=Catenulispora pinistramenti TaxID=2705254 RepID=UPI001BA75E00|nr:contact-dependent growth inhibition system immunity protein [Catenulispora pinistramenti]MBS2531999.1 hypothetical protein [Catenulispora pinistramenti]